MGYGLLFWSVFHLSVLPVSCLAHVCISYLSLGYRCISVCILSTLNSIEMYSYHIEFRMDRTHFGTQACSDYKQIYGGRENSTCFKWKQKITHVKRKQHLHLHPFDNTCCKYSQCNKTQKCATNTRFTKNSQSLGRSRSGNPTNQHKRREPSPG